MSFAICSTITGVSSDLTLEKICDCANNVQSSEYGATVDRITSQTYNLQVQNTCRMTIYLHPIALID